MVPFPLVMGHDSHRDRTFAPDTPSILKFLEELDEMDRKIVYNLVKSLKERKDAENVEKGVRV